MPRTDLERAGAQAGTRDDAGTPRPLVLLTALLGSGVVWSTHFLASYTLLAYACTSGWQGVRWALVLLTLAAFAGIGASGWLAWRWWHIARSVDRPVDDAWDARMGERTARVSFMMVMGLILAALFALGLVYEAMTFWGVPLCEPGVSA